MQSEKHPRNTMVGTELVKLTDLSSRPVFRSKISNPSLKCKASSVYGKAGEYSNMYVHIYTHKYISMSVYIYLNIIFIFDFMKSLITLITLEKGNSKCKFSLVMHYTDKNDMVGSPQIAIL